MQSSQPEIDYERFFIQSLDLLCVAGLDGYFKRVNPSWTRVLGWSEAELLSRPVKEFMHPEDHEITLQAREGLARGQPVRGLENRYLCKDGSCRWLSWQSITEPGARLVFAVARDITERRQLDQERVVLSKLESTGILAAGLAHDFNNLLASLLLNVEMVGLSGPTTLPQQQFLQQSRDTVKAAKMLTQQLITFAGGDALTRQSGDIGILVRQSVDFVRTDSLVQIECAIAPDLKPVNFNETQIAQVFRGLLLNALEASQPGGRVRVRAENVRQDPGTGEIPPGEYVRISIADEGAGIPADVLPKIFDPYFSTKDRGSQKGMGLGLTICRTVIKRHGGAIALDSQAGRGTTVVCHLPAVASHPPNSVPPRA